MRNFKSKSGTRIIGLLVPLCFRLWSALFAPVGTPPQIVKKLEAECMRIARLPDFKEKLRALSSDAVGNSSVEFTNGARR